MRVPFMDIVARYQDTPQRRVLDLRRAGLRDVPVLGWYSYSEARPDVPLHRHFGCLEVHYCAGGRQVQQVDAERFALRGGELFVTFPDEPHSTGGEPSEPGTIYWFIVRMPRGGRPLLGLSAGETTALAEKLRRVPRRHFPAPPRTKRLFDELLQLYDRPDTLLRAARMRQTIVSLLLEVVDGAARDAARPPSARLASIVERIQTAPQEEYRLKDLAREAHLSLSRLKSRFKAETGISPWQFILQSKIEAAQRRLRGGSEPISTIALELGFNSPPYFATVFKRITGLTPREYRSAARVVHPRPRRDDGQG
jgi:AraC-like DNA-binding protein